MSSASAAASARRFSHASRPSRATSSSARRCCTAPSATRRSCTASSIACSRSASSSSSSDGCPTDVGHVASESADPVRPSFAERFVAAPLQFGRDWVVRFVELQGFDRAVALAGQAFTALIPLLIVYSALRSEHTGRDFADQIIHIFDLFGSSAESVHRAFAPAGEVTSEVHALGLVLLVGSALSFTRALQRLYQLAWRQPSLGLRAAKWGLIWLAFVIAFVTVRPVVLTGTSGVVRLALSLGFGALAWLATPY